MQKWLFSSLFTQNLDKISVALEVQIVPNLQQFSIWFLIFQLYHHTKDMHLVETVLLILKFDLSPGSAMQYNTLFDPGSQAAKH